MGEVIQGQMSLGTFYLSQKILGSTNNDNNSYNNNGKSFHLLRTLQVFRLILNYNPPGAQGVRFIPIFSWREANA